MKNVCLKVKIFLISFKNNIVIKLTLCNVSCRKSDLLPPKKKFTTDEIINAALKLVRENGISNLTARGLGAKLGTSPRPIFTAFQNMDEVRKKTILAARGVYNEYLENVVIV